MNAAVEKLERQLGAANQAIGEVLATPADEAIWGDEDFWERRWPAMVDRAGALVDRIAEVGRKAIR